MIAIRGWLVVSLIVLVLVMTGVIMYDDSVITGQSDLIKAMMTNKACMIDLDLYQKNLNKAPGKRFPTPSDPVVPTEN